MGAPTEPQPNKLEVRLEGELKRYARKDLPRQIESLEPDEAPGNVALNTAVDQIRWVARVKVDDSAPTEVLLGRGPSPWFDERAAFARVRAAL